MLFVNNSLIRATHVVRKPDFFYMVDGTDDWIPIGDSPNLKRIFSRMDVAIQLFQLLRIESISLIDIHLQDSFEQRYDIAPVVFHRSDYSCPIFSFVKKLPSSDLLSIFIQPS